LLLWVLPFVVLVAGVAFGLWLMRRWSRRKAPAAAREAPATNLDEARAGRGEQRLPADSSLRDGLLADRKRLIDELKDLEFDFQCGKLSESDYVSLKSKIEATLAEVVRRCESLPPLAGPAAAPRSSPRSAPAAREMKSRMKRWQLAAGGGFLLLFGLTLGVLLTNSLRPRTGPEDSLTGDFLTGTSSASGDLNVLLNQGKVAFSEGDWAKAIEAFKKVLATDPNQPVAHTYMGLILVQAGHSDGALMAFDRALTLAPNLPMALWGKGMILYREKQDYEGARQLFGRLAQVLPEGEDKREIEKVLAELPKSAAQSPAGGKAPFSSAPQERPITGRITLASNVQPPEGAQTALFIIARSPEGGGPPVAVKKIERPTFPVAYSLGPENVMIRGAPFAGRLSVSARLDRDGDPMTREAADLIGEYKNNPVEAGSKNVDIVIGHYK